MPNFSRKRDFPVDFCEILAFSPTFLQVHRDAEV